MVDWRDNKQPVWEKLFPHYPTPRNRPGHCTCDVGHPESLLVLWRFWSVLAPLLPSRGANTAEMDLSGFEEGYGERLLVLWAVPSNKTCQFGVDALPLTTEEGGERACRNPSFPADTMRVTRRRAAGWLVRVSPRHVCMCRSTKGLDLNQQRCFWQELLSTANFILYLHVKVTLNSPTYNYFTLNPLSINFSCIL